LTVDPSSGYRVLVVDDEEALLRAHARVLSAAGYRVVTATGGAVDWSPRPDYRIAPQDRIYFLATRTGLSGVLARSQSGVPVTPA